MGVNKVIYYGEVLVDMSQVTVTPETLGKGATALDAKGDLITGTHECKETEPNLQSKTVTPTTSLQTVNPDSGYDGLSHVTVNAIPSTYVKPTATKAATTYTPTTSNQSIAAGTYCSGAQTIKGDTNLVAGNIKSGVSIFGVNGTYEGSGGGGGGSAETVQVTLTRQSRGLTPYIYYTDASSSLGIIDTGKWGMSLSKTIEVMKNTIIHMHYDYPYVSISGEYELTFYDGSSFGIFIMGDIEMNISTPSSSPA